MSESVNVNFEYLISTISELTAYCFPLRKNSRKAYITKPCITPGIRKSTQTQNKLFKDYLTVQHKLMNHQLSIKNIAIN